MKKFVLGAGVIAVTAAFVGAAGGDHVSAAAQDPQMKPDPGQYRSDIELVSIDIPGAPPQVADMMRGMMGRTVEYCLTQEEVDQGFESVARRSQEGDCNFQRFDASGGNIDALMTCDVDGRMMTMTMTGTGTSTTSDITMRMEGDMGGMGEGSMTLRAKHQRIGDC